MTSPHTASPQIVHQTYPLNSEPTPDILLRDFLTPRDAFYVRCHGSIPPVDLPSYRLSLTGMVRYPLQFTLDELRQNFPDVTVTTTLQCAGNRRSELMKIRPIPNEVPWGIATLGTARWRGVPLRALLAAAEVIAEAQHVAFLSMDETQPEQEKFPFGSSIPLEKAMQPEVLLAYEMNGQLLAPAHGFPLRVLVPGYIGARSVKWLAQITVQQQPSDNYFQQREYKRFPPDVRPENADWRQGETLTDVVVNSAIGQPQDGERLKAGPVHIKGYAIAGDDSLLEEVELSYDGGTTWTSVHLLQPPTYWTWSLWEHTLELRPGTYQLVVRARDTAGRSQPAQLAEVWNFKGYMNNAWHRVTITVEP